jgi:hypothetical protein
VVIILAIERVAGGATVVAVLLGYDLRKIRHRDRHDYRFLPPRFFNQVLEAFVDSRGMFTGRGGTSCAQDRIMPSMASRSDCRGGVAEIGKSPC